MSEKMREDFELWLNDSGQLSLKEDDGEYSFQHTRLAWQAWQASRAAMVTELSANCKGMALTVDELRTMLGEIGVTLK